MKRIKRIGILAAVLAVLCAATLLLVRFEEKQEKIRSTEQVILSVPQDAVQILGWNFSEEGFSFRREDDGWTYEADAAFPVSSEKISQILSHFEALSAAFVIKDVSDYSQYGLDDPEYTLMLQTDSQSYLVRLGDFSLMDQQRYVDLGDGNVYLVSSDPADVLYTSLSDMIQHDSRPELSQVSQIRFSGEENYTLLRKDDSTASYSEEDIYFVNRAGVDLPLNTAAVTQYLNTITSLELSEYVTYNATEAELEGFGLHDPELSIAVDYSYEDSNGAAVTDTVQLHISQDPSEKLVAQQAEEDSAATVTKYLRMGDSSIVYILNDADYAILSAAGYDDLRHSQLYWGDTELITQMEITLDGETHTLTSTPGEEAEALRSWSYADQAVDASGVLSALSDLTADSFTDAAASGKEELTLVLTLDSENVPTVTLRLYRQDGALCLAQVNGSSVSYVPRSAAVSLIEAIRAIVLS